MLRTSSRCPTDYVLCPNPAPAQIRCSAYARAFDVAKRWARRQHVDVWFTDNGKTFALVSRHRADDTHDRDLPRPSQSGAARPFGASMAERTARTDPQPLPAGRPNALVIGPRAAASALVAAFLADAAMPVADWDAGATDALPRITAGTLVVWNATRLGTTAQRHLFDYIAEHRGAVQVVTVADEDLYEDVRRGMFLDALYYRLNIVRLRVDE